MISGVVLKQTRDEAAGRARLLWPGALSLAAQSCHLMTRSTAAARRAKRDIEANSTSGKHHYSSSEDGAKQDRRLSQPSHQKRVLYLTLAGFPHH